MKTILLSIVIFCFSSLQAEIIRCKQLKELLPLIDQDTLVVFNINNVLTTCVQDAGSTPWAEEQIARIGKMLNVDKPHATNLFIPLWHDVLIASDVELFDPDAEVIIHYLQDKGVKVMALTNRYTEMGYPTHKNLRSVGIDFSKNPPYPEDTWIQSASPAKYIEGVIFNGLINFKGDTLAAFLKQINYYPKKLIYVEDKPKHLGQVGEKVTALGIPFVGVHFGALDAQRETYQTALAALQLKYHQDILDDEAAQLLLDFHNGSLPQLPQVSNNVEPSTPKQFKAIQSVHEVKQDLIPRTLVVTALDQTLWKAQGAIGNRYFLTYYAEKMQRLGDTPQVAKAKAERLFEKIQRRAQMYLIDAQAPTFFANLANQHCWSVALTCRSESLAARTAAQAQRVGLQFHSPLAFDPPYIPQGFIFTSAKDSQFAILEQKIKSAQQRPAQIVAVSDAVEDLIQVQEVAQRLHIPFKGRKLTIKQKEAWPSDEVIMLELDHLDHMISNRDAEFLLRKKIK